MLPFRIRFEDYDTILYPEGFETHHFKEAIPARNRYRVDHAAYALCFVEHSRGGAAANTWRKEGTTAFGLCVPIVLAFLFVQKAAAFGNRNPYRKDAKPQ